MRRRNQRGSTILESGLVFGVFMFMLVGTLDFGQFLFRHQSLTERVRYAGRWAIARPYAATQPANDPTVYATPDSIRNMILYNVTSFGPNEEPPATTFWGLTSGDVQVERVTGAATQPDRLVIRVRNRFLSISPYIAGTHEGRPVVVSFPYEGLD